MKTLPFLFLAFLAFSCTNDDSTDPDNNSENQISSFGIEQSSSSLIFNYESRANFEYYEISYSISSSSNDPNGAEKFTTSNKNTTTKSISELFLQKQVVYSFWIRGNTDDGKSSDWFGPKTINIERFCEEVYDLEFDLSLTWKYISNETDASYYQVQYDKQGFELGNGEVVQTSNEYLKDLTIEKGNTYDAYVRAYCTDNLGFSEWTGPVSFYATNNQNVCREPNNLNYSIEYNFFGDPVAVDINWNDDGNNKKYEFNLVDDHESPESSSFDSRDDYGRQVTYANVVAFRNYDFYVRTVCKDGSRTKWVGPLNVEVE